MSALSNLPALTRGYFTRANQPFGANNTTQLIQETFWMWSLATNLLDTNASGTASTSHTRHANSVWICRGSSDGTTGGAISAVGVAGTDRWSNGGVYDNTKFVRSSNGTNHSWMLLENVTLGKELLINVSQTAGYVTVSVGNTGLFTGGSVTTCPAPSITTQSVQMSQTGYSATDGGQYNIFTDYTTFGNQHYFHFTCADSGEFWVGSTRAGLGFFTTFLAVWETTGGESTDQTFNTFIITNSSEGASYPGAMGSSRLNTAATCASVQPSGVQKSAGGMVMPTAGGTIFLGYGVEAQTGKYISVGIPVVEITPSVVYRGVLPDFHSSGASPPGTSIPATNQVRTQTGYMIVPFTDTPPLT